jgi:hypothetical protein
MLRLTTFLLVYFFTVYALAAQNLVGNNSFDTYTTPPNDIAQVCRATGWTTPSGLCESGNGGTPDYFHTAGSGVVDPPNVAWATVSPHSGGGMEGFGTYYFVPVNWREYICRQLTTPLVVGTTYEVSFWLTNGDNSILTIGTNNIGIAFTTSPLSQNVTDPISVTPQVEITQVVYSTTWQHFVFSYTPTSAFSYMTIGNFRNDAATTIVPQTSNASSGAYYYIDDIIVQPELILPIELNNFQASVNGMKQVELTWSTASEWNADHFNIERSSDGTLFETIGTVSAAGNSLTIQHYSFTDLNPLTGINYYRLREEDTEGSYSYSEIEVFEIASTETVDFSLYPNPATVHDQLTVEFPQLADDIELIIADPLGRPVKNVNCSDDIAAAQQCNVSLRNFTPGIYFIYLKSSGQSLAAKKLLVQ